MRLFNTLPGFQRTPPGLERKILRWLPTALTMGLGLLLLPSLLLRLSGRSNWHFDQLVSMVDIYAMGAILFYCNMLVAVAVGAFVVMLMKGPAYVADAYHVDDADSPKKPPVRRSGLVAQARTRAIQSQAAHDQNSSDCHAWRPLLIKQYVGHQGGAWRYQKK